MKKFLTKSAVVSIIGLLAVPSAYANHVELNFPGGPGDKYFNCTIIADKATEVLINTHNIDLQGACSGQYVTRPGHLKMPAAVVNNFYFLAHQPLIRSGNITVDTPPGNLINCVDGGGGRPVFGRGNGFCLNPPTK